jgi:hypothetical protein
MYRVIIEFPGRREIGTLSDSWSSYTLDEFNISATQEVIRFYKEWILYDFLSFTNIELIKRAGWPRIR